MKTATEQVVQVETATETLRCNSRLLKSHMRLKKSRPYNHWLSSQGHYLLCFSVSSGRSQFGSLAT